MNVVTVNVPSGSYSINIEPGRLDFLDSAVPSDATSIAIVTNPKVGALYLSRVKESLLKTGLSVFVIELPDGEIYKDWVNLNKIFDVLLSNKMDRHAVLVALGGGVIGDITGFAASVYMRGIRFIQVPTTLLAQVDSSVGGKTAVNHPLGKNMIGSFYQPESVEIDIDVLNTLDAKQISSGLSEVIKYGLILDQDFWVWCENNINKLLSLDKDALSYAIQRSCELKAYVVGKDEKESGLRAILNLGHTFGHAIESGLGYGNWLHGEAVGCGLVQASVLSSLLFNLDESIVERVKSLVKSIGCPITAPNFSLEKWIDLMLVDKKNQHGKIRFVLITKIGESLVQDVSEDMIKLAIQETTK
ncbi:3-dehydroquinate synthase [Candidatus Kinetoplastibacterium desouzaii TCC079E]|uniref:3-dehydroquinate synthase n=1 Tax=Candidatus Kinetoplastidibacterium desouzai TCC079E TaxID=1208919 RepID=M1LVI1_9PROT|nr:3-dehydroquinate synthase [Candidatus Kinetoplastibacterium desouzaii]AGF47249.1 3-dehydroquinate synthase [Candidatus Kinetoplastibacterium desouzaii TCC079E]